MKKLAADISRAIEIMGRDIPDARQKAYAARVKKMWKEAVEDIYKTGAQLFLEHTNAVYLMNKEDVKTLIVYVDESIFAAELNARRELFRLKFLQKFGEDVEVFEIHISRGNYKKQHPYQEKEEIVEGVYQNADQLPPKPLSLKENNDVQQKVSTVENPLVKKALLKAMVADMEWKKGQDVKNNTQ